MEPGDDIPLFIVMILLIATVLVAVWIMVRVDGFPP